MLPREQVKTTEMISIEAFMHLLEQKIPVDKLPIDYSSQRYIEALVILLTLFKESSSSVFTLWKSNNPLIPFFDALSHNDEFAAIVLALHTESDQTLAGFTESLKNSKNDADIKLINLMSLKLEQIIAWQNKQFSSFAHLKDLQSDIYYSYLYQAALKLNNSSAQAELIDFFRDYHSQLEKLKFSRGKRFRGLYIDQQNNDFWNKLNLVTSNYFEKPRILEIIAEKLLHDTAEETRWRFIQELLSSKNPLNQQLERYLIMQLPTPNKESVLQLVSIRSSDKTPLPFMEFEILSPTPEDKKFTP